MREGGWGGQRILGLKGDLETGLMCHMGPVYVVVFFKSMLHYTNIFVTDF